MNIIFWIIIGGLAGFIAEKVMKSSHGLLTNIIVGIVGAFIGGWLFGLLGISTGGGFVGSLITAVVGAIVLIWLLRLVRKG